MNPAQQQADQRARDLQANEISDLQEKTGTPIAAPGSITGYSQEQMPENQMGPGRVTPQEQTFQNYQQQKQAQAIKMLSNPLTQTLGMKNISDITSGHDAEVEQARQDKLSLAKTALEDKQEARQQMADLRKDLLERSIGSKEAMQDKALSAKDKAAALKAKGETYKATNALNSNYEKQAKPYGETVDAAAKMHAIVDKAAAEGRELTPGEADQIAYAANKAADPTSVVREGEYARTTGMMPIMDQLHNRITGLWDGKTPINLKTAQMLTQAIDTAASPAKERLYGLSKNYHAQAVANGVPPSFVVPNESWRDPNMDWTADPSPTGAGTPKPTSDGETTQVVPNSEGMPTSHKSEEWDATEKKVAPEYADDLKAIRLRGERSDANQVSSAGARTPYQITPQNRQNIMKQDGYDPWASDENAARAAARIWKESLARAKGDKAKALEYYSGGAKGYPTRVLGRTADAKKETEKTTSVLPSSTGTSMGGGWSVKVN
jgi:hypothetical protein